MTQRSRYASTLGWMMAIPLGLRLEFYKYVSPLALEMAGDVVFGVKSSKNRVLYTF